MSGSDIHSYIARTIVTCIGLVALAMTSVPLAAQHIPGVSRVRYWDSERARYRAESLEEVQVVMGEWQRKWSADEPDELADYYVDEARLMLTLDAVEGKKDIEEFFEELLPTVGGMSFALTEFEVDGNMAYLLGGFVYTESDGSATRHAGQFMAFLLKDGGDWRIRSQLFREYDRTATGGVTNRP